MRRATDKVLGGQRPPTLTALSLDYLRPYSRPSLIVLLTIVVDTAFTIAFFFGMKVLIDFAEQGGDRATLVQGSAVLIVFFFVAMLANVTRDRIQATVEIKLSNALRVALLGKLLSLGPAFYDRVPTSELAARVTNDSRTIRHALTESLPTFIRYGTQLVAVYILLVFLEWRLAGIVVVAFGGGLVLMRAINTWFSRVGPAYARGDAAVTATIRDAIAGHLVLKVFGKSGAVLTGVRTALDGLVPRGVQTGLVGRLIARVLESEDAFVELVVGGIGVLMISQHTLSVGTLAAFLAVVGVAGASLNHIAHSLPEWLASDGAMRRVAAILRESPAVADASDAVALPRFARQIHFTNVGFSYHGETRFAIRHVTFSIAAGESVAFVGRNGSGKSTVLALLLRLWDPTEGTITVDGIDLRAVTQDSLHAQVGVVFQDTFLFDHSVRENITLGDPVSEEAVVSVARVAQIHDAITSLPDSYDTMLGERGRRFSVGLRQRLALARALLHDPAVLVLDEATAALDPAGEAAFVATMQRLAGPRTIVSVAHRLASIIDADRIFVMDGGQVVEQGTHQELLALDGVYRDLWDKQTGFLVDDAGRRAQVTAQRLRRIPLFAMIDDAHLALLATQFVVDRFDEGEVIVAQGDNGDKFYLIVRGEADVLRFHDGQDHRIDKLADGDYFGEMALLTESPRTATVRATVPSLLLSLWRHDFQTLLAAAPDLRTAIDQLVKVREQRISALHEQGRTAEPARDTTEEVVGPQP